MTSRLSGLAGCSAHPPCMPGSAGSYWSTIPSLTLRQDVGHFSKCDEYVPCGLRHYGEPTQHLPANAHSHAGSPASEQDGRHMHIFTLIQGLMLILLRH